MTMKSGCIMFEVDADLSDTSKKTISGIYEKAKTAINSGKPIIVFGMNYNGKKISPIMVFGWLDGETYIFSAGVLQVFIDKNDGLKVAINSAISKK